MAISPMMLGALTTGGLNIFGNWMANQANQNLAQNQQNWNQNMWNQQNQWNLEQWNRVQQRNMSVYELQRQHQLQFWNMQNQYNSPQAQMARFREAGLNPHLIYGKGSASAGNAAPLSNPNAPRAEAIKNSDVKPYTRAEMQSVTRGMDVFGDTQRFKNLQAQTDNLKAQQNVIQQDALLKAQQTAHEALKVNRGKLDYGIAKELRETSVEAAKMNLENTKLNLRKTSQGMDHTAVKINRDQLEYQIQKDLKDPRIKQAYLNIERTIKQNRGQDLQNELRRQEIELKQKGVNESDSVIWRALIQNWGDIVKFINDPKKVTELMDNVHKGIIQPFRGW